MKNLYLAAALILSLSACSKDELSGTSEVVNQDKEVQFEANINSGKATRFINAGALNTQAFSAGDQFFVGIHNNDNGPTNFSETTCLRTITVGDGPTYTPNKPVYWDDLGGRGTDSYIWGVYIHGTNNTRNSQAIDKEGKFTWTVEADQTGVTDFQQLDLLYSDNKTRLVYTPDEKAPKTRDIADLTFNHAMSRILINVKAGEGFSNSEFADATATLNQQFLAMDMDLLTHTYHHASAPEATDVKMCKKATATEGYAASFDAIVAAEKSYAAGDLIATLVINHNVYQLLAKEDFITALGTSQALQMGKYYTFNVIVSKQSIQFTASITDWSTGYETPAGSEELAQIVISTDNGGVTDPKGTDVPNNFGLFQSTDGNNYDGKANEEGVNPSTNCTYNKETGKWEYDPTLYWQGQGDDEYFRGFYAGDGVTPTFTKDGDKNSAALNAGDTDFQWGTSGSDKVSPTAGNVQMQFTHMMSQVIVNLKTETGDAAVNLEGAEVRITNTYTGGSIDLHSGAITLGTKGECLMTPSTTVSYQHTKYVLPQTLGDEVLVEITVNPNDPNSKNVYKYQLNKASVVVEGVTKKIDTWNSNTKYIYNIKIKKTEVILTAQITDWLIGYQNEDDIEIKL